MSSGPLELEGHGDNLHDHIDTSFIEEGLNSLMEESLLIAYEPEKTPLRHDTNAASPLPSRPVAPPPTQPLPVIWLLIALLLLTGAIGATFWSLQEETSATGKDRNTPIVKQTRGGTNNFSGMPARMP
ncbi:hypothetical protein FEF65_02050 [Mariprofundus erugo]|uniref:Uncharacterized protein n=1 Tax=Mariprofundus erugo TaxID=2528639 RepID=A0A5R9GQF5_9PROT|nr:hypothetical protein [Mariprofundus erugo]TLS68516.1 hypothetical protein FEF65_02050 [Mariprofundus erugo]